MAETSEIEEVPLALGRAIRDARADRLTAE